MSRDTNTELLRGLKLGSYEDFNKLYDLYSNQLYGFIFSLTKSRIVSNDILQETFLRVWNTRTRISLDRSFKTYLFTISKHLVIDAFREHINEVSVDDYVESEMSDSNENQVEAEVALHELQERLEMAKARLTKRQQVIFALSREKGWSISEIADELHISTQTVKNQLTLALNLIRDELSDV